MTWKNLEYGTRRKWIVMKSRWAKGILTQVKFTGQIESKMAENPVIQASKIWSKNKTRFASTDKKT